jgi:hypothetical protein
MLKRASLVCLAFLFLTSCKPSESAIQTAIAQTQTAAPTLAFTDTLAMSPTPTYDEYAIPPWNEPYQEQPYATEAPIVSVTPMETPMIAPTEAMPVTRTPYRSSDIVNPDLEKSLKAASSPAPWPIPIVLALVVVFMIIRDKDEINKK